MELIDFENELEEFESSFEQDKIMDLFIFPQLCVFFQCLKVKIRSLKTSMWKPPLNINMFEMCETQHFKLGRTYIFKVTKVGFINYL